MIVIMMTIMMAYVSIFTMIFNSSYSLLFPFLFPPPVDRFDNCHFIANYKQLDSEEQKYKVECDTTENGIKIDYDALEEKKGRIANIMQMLLELYSTY